MNKILAAIICLGCNARTNFILAIITTMIVTLG